MKNLTRLISLLTLLFATLGAAPAPQESWQAKIDTGLLQTAAQRETEFLVYLRDQADLSAATQLPTRRERGAYVYAQLTATAKRSQGPLLAALQARGVEYRAYWIANLVWVRAGGDTLQSLARRSDVARIFANPSVQLDEISPPSLPALLQQSPAAASGVEWNIAKIGAPQVWAAGYTGQGVVIAGQDTGYEWTHPALKSHYRGWDGAAADHNYNWYDAIHAGGSVCGADSPEPCDDHGHGTHTMGTMLGDDGAGNQVGVAPGARWIGCRNMNNGVGTPETYAACYQFFVAPTDLQGQNARPDLAPDIINNSWGCPTSEGCTDPLVLQTVVNNVRAAGILTVHSAGNSGPGCSTVKDPAAIYDASFTVGNVNSSDVIASSSSRGPVTVDGSGRVKPNVSAPGTGIRSSIRGSGYTFLSGTSMAGPHVAGLAALLISAKPELRGQVDQIEDIIEGTAIPLQTTESCGGTAGQVPNNVYGYGRIDAAAAVGQVAPHRLTLTKTSGVAGAAAGGAIPYTLDLGHLHPSTPAQNVLIQDRIPAGTAFVSATGPYTLNGDIVEWRLADLPANTAMQVELVVRVLPDAGETITNQDYAASSAEVTAPVSGPSVTTPVLPHRFFLPLLRHTEGITP